MSMNKEAIMEKPKKRTQAVSGTFDVTAVSLEKVIDERGKNVTNFKNSDRISSKDIMSTELAKGVIISARSNTEKQKADKQNNNLNKEQTGETR